MFKSFLGQQKEILAFYNACKHKHINLQPTPL